MRAPSKRTRWAIGLVALMSLMLIVLAVLQYRWIGEVTLAERARLRADLMNAVQQLRTEFNAEMRRLCIVFELEPEAPAAHSWSRLIERYDSWLHEERHVRLVEDVFLLTSRAGAEAEPHWLDAQTGQWLPSAWPRRLDAIRERLDRRFPKPAPPLAAGGFSPWQVFTEEAVLVRPLSSPGEPSGIPEISGFLLVTLNQAYFREVFLPGMMRRYLLNRPEADFEAAVVVGPGRRRILCALDEDLAAGVLEAPDVRIRLLWDLSELAPAGPGVAPAPPVMFGPQNRGTPLLMADEASAWELVARYRSGSLEEIASRSRRRNLMVSFGVLLLLGAGGTVLVFGARRAHRLAELQMRFVTGISHDLRTPLAVICSAADNLAEGVIDGVNQRVREYGALIRAEGRKLAAMVEQTLHYASMQSGSRKAEIQQVSLADLVNAALAEEQEFAGSLGVTVETEMPAGLPEILCNRAMLLQALRNLVANSLKYGSSGRWIRIQATRSTGEGKNEVSLAVEDRGPGIDPSDLPHVFEPFYRGRNAEAAGVPGSGLGLSVVKQSVEEMGGRIEVHSTRGCGSRFILHLPAARESSGRGQRDD